MSSEVFTLPAIDVSRAGRGFQLAYGSDKALMRGGVGFDGDNPFGGGGHGIVSQVHGRGSGVVCLAFEEELYSSLSHECLDDT